MNISIILCTWNNSNRLNITLSSFLNLNISSSIDWEMIVVNNNSTDSTREVIFSYLKKLPILYVEEPKQGLSYARNAGLKNAKGKLIIFTDDDIKPCKEWLNIYWDAYEKNPNGFFWGGPIESEFEKQPENMELIRYAPCSVKGLNWGKQKKILDFNKGEYFIAANWGCPVKAFNLIGGFNVELGLNPSSKKILVGEETDLMRRLIENNWRPLYLPEATIKHFVPKDKITLSHIASRVEAFGRTNVLDKNKMELESESPKQLFGVPRWMWLKLFLLWKNFVIKKMIGMSYYNDYLSFRRLKGNILSLLDRKHRKY